MDDDDLTDKMESTRLLPFIKLFGKNAISDPDISIMLRIAITASIRLSWKRSTMSVKNVE